ncbi:MAG: ribosome biogenesis GTPase Der [Holophagales bacterium]|nr:ribosome biogenesis GTPase Der [Holophagales bacterium]MYG32121.1 ribosome biogenesis GTPase Der [Holophagales bacterium]MYI80831.1 ribosome biogenesis GTPase Der [Holophagales bacterium]
MPAAIAIVGRPNVGKSTLFNRLIGRRQAIVHGTPGVTRDRLVGRFDLEGHGTVELIDTGGLVPGADPLGLNAQVEFAVDESDLLLLVVDGRKGLAAADEQVMERLRTRGRPIVVVVNKADTRAAREGHHEFYALGGDALVLLSAEHGTGFESLHMEIAGHLPAASSAVLPPAPSVAVVGRPNVGKSSLVNRLLGRERTLVSPTAGTTRDPIDSLLERENGPDYLLVDTAGIRRRSQVQDTPEELAVMLARRQIERAELVVLVVDASEGIAAGDLAIADVAWQAGRSAVVVCNKWDLVDEEKRERLELGWERVSELFAKPARINVSALTGRGVANVMPALDRVAERHRLRVPTSELNREVRRIVGRHQPPAERGRPWRFFYGTQVAGAPPTFLLFANRRLKRGHNYRRYLENNLRQTFELDGVPLRIVVRERRGDADAAGGSPRFV